MIAANVIPVIIIVLQADFRELAGKPGQIWRKSPATCPERIAPEWLSVQGESRPLIIGFVTSEIIESQTGNPALPKAVLELRVESVVHQRFAGKHGRRTGSIQDFAVVGQAVAVF